MIGASAIVVEEDKTFISFCIFKKKQFNFLKEIEIPLAYKGDDFLSCLRDHAETLNKKILEIEKISSFRVRKTFLEIPESLTFKNNVEETVPLKRKKRITPADIIFVKKYLENKFLDWDEHCIHNIAINYEIDSRSFDFPPIGIWAKNIKIRAILIGTKDTIYRKVEDVFSNFNRRFSGFIVPYISMFSSVFDKAQNNQAVVSINYNSSYFMINKKVDFIFGQDPDFSIKRIIEELSRRFLVDFSLAEELFYRYVSFKEISYFKEITIKKEGGYINISLQALNSFIKEHTKEKINVILKRMLEYVKEESLAISFIGRLNAKEGFYSFLKECVPYPLKLPIQNSSISSSFGCLRYGILRFLERNHVNEESFLARIIGVYKEYF
jgi:cell division ATPase FtsA